MALYVYENGNQVSHVTAAGFAMNTAGTPPSFNWTLPAITVAQGGVAPTVTGFTMIANDAYGAVTTTANSSDQRVVRNADISVQVVNGVATISFATLNVALLSTNITVTVANGCGSATQSFLVTVQGARQVTSRYAPHFSVRTNGGNYTNHGGVDLTGEGLEICYGWKNTGGAHAPTHQYVRDMCGQYKRILIGGWRCGTSPSRGNMVRFTRNGGRDSGNDFTPITLSNNRRFINFLPNLVNVQFNGNNMDTGNRYKWMMSKPWYLLGVAGNGWSDPGRLWEPSLRRGGTGQSWSQDCRGCNMGHVLSARGNNAHDQHRCCGDTYVIYGKDFYLFLPTRARRAHLDGHTVRHNWRHTRNSRLP